MRPLVHRLLPVTPAAHLPGLVLLGIVLAAWPTVAAEPSAASTSENDREVDPEDSSLAEDGLGAEFDLLAQEEAVVFSAAKHEQPISDSPATITVIEREQIAHTHCLSLACLLRQVPGIEVRRLRVGNHALGARALVTEMNDKAQLLIDGREVNVEAFGMPLWQNLPIHLDDIERIEVVRGPGSSLYGANAHSLVVSITTRHQQEFEAFAASGEHQRPPARRHPPGRLAAGPQRRCRGGHQPLATRAVGLPAPARPSADRVGLEAGHHRIAAGHGPPRGRLLHEPVAHGAR